MSDELIVAQCSPTLAGLKTGSLFTCEYEDKKALLQSIRDLNVLLVPKGARLIPLKFMKNRVLLYLYRPSKLKADLMDEEAGRILCDRDYPCSDCSKCIARLIERLNEESAEESGFPHEIGLFLGYPSYDVRCFIEEGPGKAKKCGIWKVYGDEEASERRFRSYKKCSRLYMETFKRNNDLEKLIIKSR